MTTNLPQRSDGHPKDSRTGLTLPLSKSLGSQDLGKHRAMVALELEVLAKKMDRFGWDRDRGSAAHDRLVMDWMDALQDYPLDEIQAACKAAVEANPNKIPNEGHIVKQIKAARLAFIAKNPLREDPQPCREPVSRQRAVEIMQEAGYAPKRIPEAEA